MVSPVMHMRRTAMEDTEIAGQRIAKDEKVIMWYGAANRDPSVFPNPDQFDMMRDNVDKHLAFGHGVHRCLGNRVAQLQLKMAYERILERFPNITGPASRRSSPLFWCMRFRVCRSTSTAKTASVRLWWQPPDHRLSRFDLGLTGVKTIRGRPWRAIPARDPVRTSGPMRRP